jgi:hypothetical protein
MQSYLYELVLLLEPLVPVSELLELLVLGLQLELVLVLPLERLVRPDVVERLTCCFAVFSIFVVNSIALTKYSLQKIGFFGVWTFESIASAGR